ncbi:succinate--CoA ligase subunit alpha [Candidatus Woesearchaeota archaeon]|nr:succinate--CoA ligase subunit alpha [Candidatus Woesearchaeota archaeon]
MGILINKKTRSIVQGITGKHGSFHTRLMRAYGTNIVAGVTPGKGGREVETVPVYNTVKEALRNHQAEWSVIFVPAPFAKSAAFEALNAGLHIVIITENIPILDSLQIMWRAKQLKRVVIGPNCPGITSVDECKLGIMPNHIFTQGDVGVVSRSGTLTYEIIHQIARGGLGQTTAVGIGGDPIGGVDFVDILERFEHDVATKRIVLIGEIGGDFEVRAADYIKEHVTKPVVAYIAGQTAPPGKRMGHAGAIITGNRATAQAKIDALRKAGVPVAKLPSEVVRLLKKGA